ncbi:MAG: 50S ribosomal protein L18 [Thermofilaceae archaeon]
MAKSGRYKVPFRRRREGVTDYYRRRRLILSRKPRFVVRVTNKYIIAQVIEAKPFGDITIVAAHSKELVKEFGWKGGTKNLPAAYLVGMLAAWRALKRGVKEAVLDIGLKRAIKGARVFAAAKGAIDAGLLIPLGEEVFPDEDRIKGVHIAEYAKMLQSSTRKVSILSDYFKRGLDPVNIPSHFEETVRRIQSSS